MAIAYNTSAIRDGLVFHLDSSNTKGYPGPVGSQLVTNTALLLDDGNTINIVDTQSVDLCSVEANKSYLLEYGPVTFNSFTAPGVFTVNGSSTNIQPSFLADVIYPNRIKCVIQVTSAGTLRIQGAAVGANFNIGFVSVKEVLSGGIENWLDISNSKTVATISGGAVWYTNIFAETPQQAMFMNFPSDISFIDCGDINPLYSGGSFSMSLWLNRLNSNFEQGIILTDGLDFIEGGSILLAANGNNTVSFLVSNGTDVNGVNSVSALSETGWSNVSVTWSAANGLKLYMNGINDTNAAPNVVTSLNTNTSNLRINGDASGNAMIMNTFLIGSLQIYNNELTSDEVRKNFEAFRGRYQL